jgi:ankyrin repeat protein
MHRLKIAVAVALLAWPLLGLAEPARPGWDRAAEDLRAYWSKGHPGDAIVSLARVPGDRFRSKGDLFEVIYVLEVTIHKAGGDKSLRVGVNYAQKGSTSFVLEGIDETLAAKDERILAGKAVPLLDAKVAQLFRGIKANDLPSAQAALAAGADPQAVDEDGVSALTWAAQGGNLRMVKLLLDSGASVNPATEETIATPLMAAVSTPAAIEVVRLLLDKGASVDARNVLGNTALALAPNATVAKLLLDHGAKVDARGNAGETPLMSTKHADVAKLLIQRRADVNARDRAGRTALVAAAEEGRREVAQVLLDKGADLGAQDADGRTALVAAAGSRHAEVLPLLLGKHADVAAKDNRGRTALTMAVSNGVVDTVKLLLDHGADAKSKDGSGKTMLMMAAEEGSLPMVKLLVERGADILAKDSTGRTAKNLAADRGAFDVVTYLGAKENSTSPPTATAGSPAKQGSLDAATCRDPCALLSSYAYADLAAHACRMCADFDATYCAHDFPWADPPSCDAYDELRNCIYARFGYVFAKPKWAEHFGKLPWYKPDPRFTEAKLPTVAKANIKKLKELKAEDERCR